MNKTKTLQWAFDPDMQHQELVDHPEKDRQMVMSLGRGLAILSAFRANQPTMSNGDLVRATGLPKSSVSRLTHTLLKLGYLEYASEQRAYRLGPRVLSLGYAMHRGMALRQIAMNTLTELANLCQGMAGLATLQGHGMLMVEVVHDGRQSDSQLQVGVHTPLEKTAMGRVYLASCGQAQSTKLLAQLSKARGLNMSSLQAVLSAARQQYQATGVCLAIRSWRSDHSGVATDLMLPDLGSRMVLTVGAHHEHWTESLIDQRITPALLHAARRIERAYAKSHQHER